MRILFTWELGANSGHWAHIQPIAERLVESGHDVSVALRHIDAIRNGWKPKLPIDVFQSPLLSTPPLERIAEVRSYAHILNNVGYCNASRLEVGVKAWRDLFELAKPDAIVFDHSPTALLAARQLDCQHIVIGDGFCIPPNTHPLPDLQPWLPPDTEKLGRDEAHVLGTVNDVLTRTGNDPLNQLSNLHSEAHKSFLLTLPELDHYGPRSDHQYWGVWSPTGLLRTQWTNGSFKKIFVYSRPFPGIGQLLQALSKIKAEIIAYIPNVDARLAQAHATPLFRFQDEPIELELIAGDCNLAILNGNVNTAMNFLLAGVPGLHIPIYLEQALGTFRLTQANLGVSCPAAQLNEFDRILENTLDDKQLIESARQFSARYAAFRPEACQESIHNAILG